MSLKIGNLSGNVRLRGDERTDEWITAQMKSIDKSGERREKETQRLQMILHSPSAFI